MLGIERQSIFGIVMANSTEPLEKAVQQIEQRRKILGISQRALSEMAGMAPNYLNQAVAGVAKPKASTLFQFAQVLGCSIDDLYQGNGNIDVASMSVQAKALARGQTRSHQTEPRGASPSASSDLVKIPEYDVLASAGGGSNVEAEPLRDEWNFSSSFVSSELRVAPSNAVIIEVRGDSMEPKLFSGDRIMVDRADKNISMPGVFLIHDGWGTVVKRVERVPSTEPPQVRLVSDNDLHAPYVVDASEITIIGRVVWRAGRV